MKYALMSDMQMFNFMYAEGKRGKVLLNHYLDNGGKIDVFLRQGELYHRHMK